MTKSLYTPLATVVHPVKILTVSYAYIIKKYIYYFYSIPTDLSIIVYVNGATVIHCLISVNMFTGYVQ